MRDIFVIDDTGSPGNRSESLMLKSDRCTYLAVLIEKNIREDLTKKIIVLLKKYEDLDIKEFHFTDLLNRRKEYSKLETNEVKEIFENFATILNSFKLTLFVQTMTSRTFEENGLIDNGNMSVEEKALHFVISRIFIHVKDVNPIRNFEIFCDEGMEKAGTKKYYEKLNAFTDRPFVTFMSSHSDVLLQVADFYAFCLNRHQMLAIKEKRTDFDRWFIEMTNIAFENCQSSGFRAGLMKEKAGAEEYDQVILQRYKETGSYPFWKKFNSKKDM
ncbi:hypothetical protein CRN76_05505 [Chryseobacterium indologenes]|uniref:DUF3800 domain-containing protein n=1 Tax=Chryseobacterium TaxID=59732 RepID=UPI000BFC0E87|nr:DUF3800 domain-containing protein [Chryseobacterium indologenes]ATN04893.1 hypothetical protein CRN76_05505 [Chryseobacterium indologenes]QIX83259.1 DUF3800 domain-containing protein [Chryseobacterium indologenes]UDQ52944.1 DUF3800 domain-containing protein [Chryseobacterium indologenes]